MPKKQTSLLTSKKNRDSTMESVDEILESDEEELHDDLFKDDENSTSDSKSVAFVWLYNTTLVVFNVCKVYLLWIFLHHVGMQIYIKYCAPPTLIGMIMYPFLASTPHCKAIRWVIYNSGITFDNMFSLLTVWIYNKINVF